MSHTTEDAGTTGAPGSGTKDSAPVSQSMAVSTCRGDKSELVEHPWNNDVTLTRHGKCSEGLEPIQGPARAALTLPVKLRRQSQKKVT